MVQVLPFSASLDTASLKSLKKNMKWLATLVLGLCASPAVVAAKATHSTALYKQFFPAWDEMLKGYLENDCLQNITDYRNASFEDTHISYVVFGCLLEQFPEFRKVCLSLLIAPFKHKGPCFFD